MRGPIDIPPPHRVSDREGESGRPHVLIATTAQLSFISFWRGASIVLMALLSSAFYIGGLAEEAIGKSAPWYILGTLLLACAVSSIYLESSSLFVRNGYREIKPAIGSQCAKVSVATLMLDYLLIGPVRGVIAGQYLAGFLFELYNVCTAHRWFPAVPAVTRAAEPISDGIAMIFCVMITLYYLRLRVLGKEISGEWPIQVMQLTTIMVVLLLGWGIWSAFHVGANLPPLPTPSDLHFSRAALGLFHGTTLSTSLGLFGIIIALGHSVLAMSGEETLAEVNREIEHPKLKNLKLTAMIIATYSFAFTGVASFLAVMLIPDSVRVPVYRDNLIAGLAINLVGPFTLKISFRLFVLIVAISILSGAISTSLGASTDFITRLAEDGLLPDWLRRKHPKFGTPHRIITSVALLQILAIAISRGSVASLVQVYAFSVIWTFAIKGTIVLIHRLRGNKEVTYKVPINVQFGNVTIPVGLIATVVTLYSLAVVNLFTQPTGAVCGLFFTTISFLVFSVHERLNQVKGISQSGFFTFESSEDLSRALEVRPGCVLVCLRDYNTIFNLEAIMDRVNPDDQDIVAVFFRSVTVSNPSDQGSIAPDTVTAIEEQVFARAQAVAESKGQHVHLAVVSTEDIWDGIVQTAVSLRAAVVILGVYPRLKPREEFLLASIAWERLPEPKMQCTASIFSRDSQLHSFHLGPHAPTLSPDAVLLVHELWLRFREDLNLQDVQHSEIIALALLTLKAAIDGHDREEVLKELRERLSQIQSEGSNATPLGADTWGASM